MGIIDKLKSARLTIWLLSSLLILVMICPRLTAITQWNSWVLQLAWHTFDVKRSSNLTASVPSGHERAKLWLAQEALTTGDIQQALSLIQPLILQNNQFALRIQSAAMEKQGNYSGALRILVRIHSFNLMIDFANRMADIKDYAYSLAAFNAALTMDPQKGALPLANFLADDKGDFVSADTVLSKALANFPDSYLRLYWYRKLGNNLRVEKHFDEAELIYRAALAKYPNDQILLLGLGWVYYEHGDGSQMAIKEFQKAIAIDESRGEGYLAVAQLLMQEQQHDEADGWYRLAIEHDPNEKGWYVAWANNARSAHKLDLALAIYKKAARLFPDYPAVYYEMAWAYRLNDRPVEAQESIEKALALMDTPNELFYVRAGQIYEWQGETDKALKAYRNALAINPKNVSAQKGASRLGGP